MGFTPPLTPDRETRSYDGQPPMIVLVPRIIVTIGILGSIVSLAFWAAGRPTDLEPQRWRVVMTSESGMVREVIMLSDGKPQPIIKDGATGVFPQWRERAGGMKTAKYTDVIAPAGWFVELVRVD